MDWREIHEAIHDEFDKSQSEQDKSALLGLFNMTMDLIERQVSLTPEDLAAFRETRNRDYNLLIVKESVIGEHVSIELLNAATQREVAVGRMSPNHELRQAALKGLAEPFETNEEMLMVAMVKHAHAVVALQQPTVEQSKFDFLRQFVEQATELFLFGAILRYGDRYECRISHKDRAFAAMIRFLMTKGLNEVEAKERAWTTHQLSTNKDGNDDPFVRAGFEGGLTEGALARVLGTFTNDTTVSGAPYRMLDRAKPISIIIGVACFAVSLLLGQSFFIALGVGIVVGIASIAISLVIYRQMVRARWT